MVYFGLISVYLDSAKFIMSQHGLIIIQPLAVIIATIAFARTLFKVASSLMAKWQVDEFTGQDSKCIVSRYHIYHAHVCTGPVVKTL